MKKNNKNLEKAAKTFAASRGWKLARREADLFEIAAGRRSSWRTGFASDQLGRMFDHAEFYEWAGSRRPAAIVVHPYGHFSQSEVDAVAKLYRLKDRYSPNPGTIPTRRQLSSSL